MALVNMSQVSPAEQNFINNGVSTLLIDPLTASRRTNGISKLAQMQARFQQKQLQEKEQKLLRLYETQQQRAFQRVGRGSAGSSSTSSTTSSSSLGNGKVRQLFDERRTGGQQKVGITNVKSPGWDRSYPLEPLAPAARNLKLNRGASLERLNASQPPIKKIVSRSRSQVRVNGNYRQQQQYNDYNYNEDEVNYIQDELDAANYYRDKPTYPTRFLNNNNNNNRNDTRYLDRYDDDRTLGDGETFDETQLFKKLSNVGGILLMKERTMNEDKYKTYNANARKTVTRGPGGKEEVAPPRAAPRREVAQPRTPPNKVAAGRTMVKRQETEQTSVSPPPSNSPTVRRTGTVNLSKNPVSPPLRSNFNSNKAPISQEAPVSSPRNVVSSKSPPTPSKAAPRPKVRAASTTAPGPMADNLTECKYCSRRFASDRVDMHQDICAKTAQKKRKVFDPVKQRVAGTEAEAYVKLASKQQKQQVKTAAAPAKKSDWRRKHEEFISAIRAAKEVKAHLAAGGKLSDLPPPPPSENLDYIQCPHCSRRFNEAAAERHIPRCADMQHNKPKVKVQAAKPGSKAPLLAKKR